MSHYLRDVFWMGRAELKASHHEVSPKERDDEERRWEHEFGSDEWVDEHERDRLMRQGDTPGEQTSG